MTHTIYEVIIGLEIHLRLNTRSKMFCDCQNAESEQPNVYVCPICLGHPGTLPQLNAEAVRLGTLLALSLHCDVQQFCKFDRKQYFYSDLPKGYQISQYDQPLATGGYLDILTNDITPKRVRIERIHLEEDSAKLKHANADETRVDFNRSGTPLAELVTQADMRTPQEAKIFAQELQLLARSIGASQADMEKGHMRCDVNVSLRPAGDEALYPKTEIKNVNSFRSIERAIVYEMERQRVLWEAEAAPEQTTTRGWDDKRGVTVEQRIKEGAADYRYFPEPDIPPLRRTPEAIEALRHTLPELPYAKRTRFQEEYALSYADATVITEDVRVADFFEKTISELRSWLNALDDAEGSDEEMWKRYRAKLGRLTAGWITSEVFKLLKESGRDFGEIACTPENFAELLTLIYEKRINSTAGQKILKYLFEHGGDPSVIMQEQDLEQTSESGEIEGIVDGIIRSNPAVVQEYKSGKTKALMFLVGQLMKTTKGKVNPEVATELLKKRLAQTPQLR